MNNFAFTCGDVNGIGPEIVVKTLNKIFGKKSQRLFFICPVNVFESVVKIVKPKFPYETADNFYIPDSENVLIISTGTVKTNTGIPTKDSGDAAFKSIEAAARLAVDKKIDAIITAPISKEAINSAGHYFPGHTEMFAHWCGEKNFVMTFLSGRMNAALATIHVSVNEVPRLITKKMLRKKLEIIINTLKTDLKKKSSRIAVLGLNPHAGENGLIGTEEEKIIRPLIQEMNASADLEGPFSPDAFFANSLYKKYDFVFGMYHDQVLIPFKMLNFGAGVNFTAGLPIVRTSPDHGTAFDIAGKNIASESSMAEAFKYASLIVKNRKEPIGK